MVPTFQRYADEMSPRLTPSSYVIEVDETSAVIRFQGTELVERWHVDRTGNDVYRNLPDHVRKRAHAAVLTVATFPCGLIGRNTFRLPSGVTISADFIQLPLRVDEGCLPRVVHYSSKYDNDEMDDATATFFKTTKPQWLDIGFGVPPDEPKELDAKEPRKG